MMLHDENNSIKTYDQLKINCSACSGLCCTALLFSKTDGFPVNKTAGKPCVNLQHDFRCTIHKELTKRSLKGCIGYDCFGAGQYVTQVIYKGESWKSLKEQSQEIFDVFLNIYKLFQIRYFLLEAYTLIPAKALWIEIQSLISENESMCSLAPAEILSINIADYRNRINFILRQVCGLVGECFSHEENTNPTHFLGKNFSHKNMSGLDFSMHLLIAADFKGCIFDGTNFLGADTRDTNFHYADLREAVFLTQGQVNSAKGNKDTKLPRHLDYPAAWI